MRPRDSFGFSFLNLFKNSSCFRTGYGELFFSSSYGLSVRHFDSVAFLSKSIKKKIIIVRSQREPLSSLMSAAVSPSRGLSGRHFDSSAFFHSLFFHSFFFRYLSKYSSLSVVGSGNPFFHSSYVPSVCKIEDILIHSLCFHHYQNFFIHRRGRREPFLFRHVHGSVVFTRLCQ